MARWRILAISDTPEARLRLADAAQELTEPVRVLASAAGAEWPEEEPHAAIVGDGLSFGAGLQEIRALRRRSCDLVIVAVAAPAEDGWTLEALRAGADDVVAPSTPPGEVLRRTATLVGLKRGALAEVREAQARLRALEERYRTLVEHARHGVAMVQRGRIAYINAAGAAMGGLAPQDLVGRPFSEVLAPSSRANIGDIHARLADAPGSTVAGEAVLEMVTGRRVPIGFSAVASECDGKRSVVVMFSDVSERLAHQEAALRRSRELEMLHGLALELAASLEIDRVVEAGCRRIAEAARLDGCAIYLLERESRQLVLAGPAVVADGMPPAEPSLDELDSQLLAEPVVSPGARGDEADRDGRGATILVPLRARDALVGVLRGERRPGAPLTSQEVQLVSAAATSVGFALENARLYATLRESYGRIVDTQAELVRAERLAALGELSATVAHEVRNPLAAIYNSLAQLRRLVPEGGDATTLLDIAQEEATRLNRIIADLLQFARPGEPDLRPTPLDEIIELAVRAAGRDSAARRDVPVSVEPVDPELHALCDGSRLRQALVNLVVNAFQAADGPGAVRVRARPAREADEVLIEVEDDGPGIPEAVAERVFDPFFTTRPAGSGLGLAIVKRVIEDQRGSVTLHTAPGLGARFEIRLRRVPAPSLP